MTVLTGAVALAALPTLLGAAERPSTGLSASTVIADALASVRTPYSGLVQVDGRLGLPALPIQSQATAQLDQSSRIRTWWLSPITWRTDTLGLTGQQEEVAAATSAATLAWDYERNTVQVLPISPGVRLPRTADLMPPAAARTLLAWRSAADRVSALPPQLIAGRDASGARVTSGEAASSVSSLTVWVDTATGLPLELDVYVRADPVPVFRTRFLDVSLERPNPAVVSPVLPPSAHWSMQRRDLLEFIQSVGSTTFPAQVAGLPATTSDTGLPAGIASYGSGFARVSLLELPDRLVPRVEEAVGAQTVAVGTGRAAVLRTGLLQVALLETAGGRGYLLAGTLTGTALDAAVRDALAALPASRAPEDAG
ncbi:MAG: hypothetical protein ACHQE5_03890 [Actinomycetes bacterium]